MIKRAESAVRSQLDVCLAPIFCTRIRNLVDNPEIASTCATQKCASNPSIFATGKSFWPRWQYLRPTASSRSLFRTTTHTALGTCRHSLRFVLPSPFYRPPTSAHFSTAVASLPQERPFPSARRCLEAPSPRFGPRRRGGTVPGCFHYSPPWSSPSFLSLSKEEAPMMRRSARKCAPQHVQRRRRP